MQCQRIWYERPNSILTAAKRIIAPLILLCISTSLVATPVTVTSQESALEVISVTATKTDLAINQAPHSVTSILADQIAVISAQHISQVLDAVPGTWISRGNGQEHLTAIRSPVLTGAGSCGAFFMGLDGISIRAPGFCNANQLFDINYEQARAIDVLRSPASTLYGSNALHGVINIISENAFNDMPNTIGIGVGANDFGRLMSRYGQVKQNSAWLNLFNVTQENGYQAQSGYDQQKMTHIYQTQGTTWDTKSVFDISNLNQETAGFIEGFKSYKDDAIRRSNPNPEAYRDAKSIRAYSTFTRAENNSSISITPYLRWNEMTFLQHFLPWQALEENSHQSAGLQTVYRYVWKNIDWVSGVDIDFTRASLVETQAQDFSPSVPKGLHYDYKVNAHQLSAYTQGSWEYNNWTLSAGARIERTLYDYTNQTQSPSACASNVDVCRFSRPDSQSIAFNALSPSLNIKHLLSNNLSVYAKYSQGYRAPQATELFRLQNNQQVADIDTENMDAFETGLRYSSSTTSAHLAAFLMNKKDGIFQNTERQNVSGAKTKHTGIELELRQRLATQWQVSGHISYARHTYQNNPMLVSGDIVNNLIDTAPKWLSNINMNYAYSDKLTAQLRWQYTSKYFLDPQNTAQYEGHQLYDLNLYYKLSESVSLRAHMLNLTNQDYAQRADFTFGSYRYFVGQPRQAFFNVAWSY